MVSESQIISQILHHTRRLTRWYLSLIPDDAFLKRIEVEGQQINSPYWIAAHLIWAEATIAGEIGGPTLGAKWRKFRIGSKEVDAQADWPSLEILKSEFMAVHKAVGTFLSTLPDQHLDLIYPDKAFHKIFKTNREALYHLIRHEAYHAGQLGLLCKVCGIKTI